MKFIDGKTESTNIYAQLQERVRLLAFQPVFVDIIVGNDPVSLQYISMKEKRAETLGIRVQRVMFPESITTDDLCNHIREISKQKNICGLIVQLPLPLHLDTQTILDSIPAEIDVDTLGTLASNNFYQAREHHFGFPAAQACMRLLATVPHHFDDRVVILGQGMLVGKPVKHLLECSGYTDIRCATKETGNAKILCQDADIVITATGVPRLITQEYFHDDMIVIDAGTAEFHGGVVGDVCTEDAESFSGYLAPVPGGVGPMTIACLLQNIITVAESKKYE